MLFAQLCVLCVLAVCAAYPVGVILPLCSSVPSPLVALHLTIAVGRVSKGSKVLRFKLSLHCAQPTAA
jgi:hypothetical protein